MPRLCLVSHRPIEPGSYCVAVVLRRMPGLTTTSEMYETPYDLWAPVSLPVWGVMDDEGIRFTSVEESWKLDALWAWLHGNVIPHASKFPQEPVTTEMWADNPSWDDLYGRIRQGVLRARVHGVEDDTFFEGPLGVTFIAGDVFEALTSDVDTTHEHRIMAKMVEVREQAERAKTVSAGIDEALGEGATPDAVVNVADALMGYARMLFRATDTTVPFYGEGAATFHRNWLAMNHGSGNPDAPEDIAAFVWFCNKVRKMGVLWRPNLTARTEDNLYDLFKQVVNGVEP